MNIQLERYEKPNLFRLLARRALGGSTIKYDMNNERLRLEREKNYENYVKIFSKNYCSGNEVKAKAEMKRILCQTFKRTEMAIEVSPQIRPYRVFLGDTNFMRSMEITSQAFSHILETELEHDVSWVSLDKEKFLIKIGLEKPKNNDIPINQNQDAIENFLPDAKSKDEINKLKKGIFRNLNYNRGKLRYIMDLNNFTRDGLKKGYLEHLTLIAHLVKETMGHEVKFKIINQEVVGLLKEIKLEPGHPTLVKIENEQKNAETSKLKTKIIKEAIERYSKTTDKKIPLYTCILLKDEKFSEEMAQIQKLLNISAKRVAEIDRNFKTYTHSFYSYSFWDINRPLVLEWNDKIQKIIDSCRDGKMGYKIDEPKYPWVREISNILKFVQDHKDFVTKGTQALYKSLTSRQD